MSVEDIPTDDVNLFFMDGYATGRYRIRIEREGTSVETFSGESPEEIALELINYNLSCVFHSYDKGTTKPMVYYGSGSERGRWELPWLTRWELHKEGIQLTSTQDKLFEAIIGERNSFIRLLEDSSLYTTLTDSREK